MVARIDPPSIVAVLGGGNMGSGIAQAAAQSGYSVRVRDVSEALIDRGRGLIEKTLDGGIQRGKVTPAQKATVLGHIAFTTNLAEAVEGAHLVVEAVFEELAVKRALFGELGPLLQDSTIVATNTSSLSVAKLSEGFPVPERFAGLHFFFPAAVNRLLEVIAGPRTSSSTLAALESFGYRLRKVPIRAQDSAGFAVNRYFVPYLNEATRMLEDDVAGMGTIEAAGRELLGTSLGPFELMNVTGIPIAFHSEGSLEAAFGPAYAPSRTLGEQFRSGEPWKWKGAPVEAEQKARVQDRFRGLIFGIVARLVEEGVATAEAVDRGATVGLRWARGPFDMMGDRGLDAALGLVEEFRRPWGDRFPVSEELRRRAAAHEPRWLLRRVRTERDGAVVWVLLDRPEVLNSLNTEVLEQLSESFQELERDRKVRVVVLAGTSPVFAAGADIGEMAQKDLAQGRAFGFAGQAVCRQIEEFRTPVIALVEGYALGGGLELALACDFILAADGAQLGLPEVTVGIHPGFGGASRLTRLIGPARAKLVVFTGAQFSATEAARLGFVARVLDPNTARADTAELARQISERAPLAVAWVKSVIRRGLDAPLDTALRLEGESAGHTFATADRTEGMSAFLERRKPKFVGE